jgi:hypothetical protein
VLQVHYTTTIAVICRDTIAKISKAAFSTVLLYFFAMPLQSFEKLFAVHFQLLPFCAHLRRFLDKLSCRDRILAGGE